MWRHDAEVRALIVTGAGEKAFVAGADINQLAVLTPIEAQAYAERGQRVFRAIEMLAKPTLAAINGYALGGGLELAMSCAVRVASENAQLGQPEVKLGILPRVWRHAAAAAPGGPRAGARNATLRRADNRRRRRIASAS